MTSETREIAHDQHSHPDRAFYIKVGVILIVATVFEVIAYIGETKEMYSGGVAALLILSLSAFKFVLVVAMYMHLKFDNKLFTGIFIFPAALGTLVIGSIILLFGVLHGTSTVINRTPTAEEGIHGPSTNPTTVPVPAHE
jgi:cytochrome c oxidase subunit 4